MLGTLMQVSFALVIFVALLRLCPDLAGSTYALVGAFRHRPCRIPPREPGFPPGRAGLIAARGRLESRHFLEDEP